MFSFHKPRVYRSTEGCCICRAKSSSSRFTDSRKYEEDSMKCFDLKYPRYGEICNACVLLVKRYKRLPAGSQRHWGHVVDARAGPGTKTITKIKRNKGEHSSDNTNTNTNACQSSNVQSGKSVISEKFSKIFKKSKNKKIKQNSLGDHRHDTNNGGNKIVNKSPKKIQNKMTLFTRNNSIESDDVETTSHDSSPAPISPQNVVEFQTQTRSSSNRLKGYEKEKNSCKLSANRTTITTVAMPKISGSKRRKKLKPKKNKNANDTNIKFFDESEWVKRTTCCGIYYECQKMPEAVIIDLDQFKLCTQHKRNEMNGNEKVTEEKIAADLTQRTIKATLPAIVKINLPLIDSSTKTNATITPVLKKHHLFYKRQSESFPKGDMITTTTTTTAATAVVAATAESTIKSKTEINLQAINSKMHVKNDLPQEASKIQGNHLSSMTTNLPRYTNAKVSTLISPIEKTVIKSSDESSSSSFLHKIKSDAGKIVKRSVEKLSSAVRIKSHDLADIKHIIKTVDKNFIVSKAGITPPPTPILAVPVLSPTSSSSSSTKFSDNSSDSGFDENVQDRKSVSPLQQENDTKNNATRPSVQTLILASGVRVHGQQQNLVYAGNEAAAKILQNRLQQQNATASVSNNNTILQHNKRLNVQPLTIDPATALKLVQAKTNNNIVSITPYNIGNIKMRSFYNTNAIQHENGITTIVPASSMDVAQHADTRMQASAPNTVTITPTSSNQIRLSAINSVNPNYQYCDRKDSINGNQKFILLKTNATVGLGPNYNCKNSQNNSELI